MTRCANRYNLTPKQMEFVAHIIQVQNIQKNLLEISYQHSLFQSDVIADNIHL